MITGAVNSSLEAIVPVTLIGPRGARRAVDAVVDTGFNGQLALPRALVDALGLPWCGERTVELADGSDVVCDVYHIRIEWDGSVRKLRCEATDTEPFVGTELLQGHRLEADFIPGGRVRIAPIP
jgi:clan AA aspartic protease